MKNKKKKESTLIDLTVLSVKVCEKLSQYKDLKTLIQEMPSAHVVLWSSVST